MTLLQRTPQSGLETQRAMDRKQGQLLDFALDSFCMCYFLTFDSDFA